MLAAPIVLASLVATSLPADGERPARFEEVSATIGLEALNVQRVAVADCNNDGRPDLLLSRDQLYLQRLEKSAALGFRFERVESGLRKPGDDGVTILVDLDGDGTVDAVSVMHLDAKEREARTAAKDESPAGWWQRGRGDGTFEAPIAIAALQPSTAAAIAAGDVDRDGRTDLFVGNWYRVYGESNEAFPADLLLNRRGDDGLPRFERQPLPEYGQTFDEDHDLAGRPIYGALIAQLLDPARSRPPQLLELAYGRRWNRLYARDAAGAWTDRAPLLGLDGDADRSGKYPEWLAERGKTDPRFAREDEKPFRSNGNTFDGAIGDVDNDGRFDLLVIEIAHAWAGPSSDRSRLLFQRPAENEAGATFVSDPAWNFDRIPTEGDANSVQRWNQGDLFGDLADFNLDGRLDLLVASGDYPDPPPFDERLRLFTQLDAADPDGKRLADRTQAAGLDQIGCAQLAVADFDLDGRPDIVAGQSFNRFTPEMVKAAGGTPRLKLWLNRTGGATPPPTLALDLRGDPSLGIATQPFGAIVAIESGGRRQLRQLVGPGGHSGKSNQAILEVALPDAAPAAVTITWPSEPPRTSTHQLTPGRHTVRPRAPGADRKP